VGFAMFQTGLTGLDSFNVPERLLEILGLSQAVFVAGRFAKPTSLGELNDLLDELRKRHAQLRQAAATGIDVDSDGNPAAGATAAAAAAKPFTTFAAASAPGAVRVAAQRYEETASSVEILLQSLSHRSVNPAPLLKPKL